MSRRCIDVTVAKKSFSQPSTVKRSDGFVSGLAKKGGSKMIFESTSSILTSKSGKASFLAMLSGLKISHKACKDTAMEATKPSITMLFTKSTYDFQVEATLDTFSASLESLTNLWISLPPSPISITFMPTRSLCFRSNSSMPIGFAPFGLKMIASLHQLARMPEIKRRLPFMMSTTPLTSLTTFMVFSMNSGMRSSLRHFSSVRPGARAASIFWMRSSRSGSSTGRSSVSTELYMVTMWSSWATQWRYVADLLKISRAWGGTSMSKMRKKRTSRSSRVSAGSKFTFSKPVFSWRRKRRIFNFSLAMSTEVFSQA
mmetsp:Transcript_168782/g.542463  ORF Transcript_168782/g.542463 Transcript_168782/m.542463 type:complete len:314 (+) Transcript_168782:3004-3945(+)